MWGREGHGQDDHAAACTCTIKGLMPSLTREDIYVFLHNVLHVEIVSIKVYHAPPNQVGVARSDFLSYARIELAKISDIPKVNSLDGAAPSFNGGQPLSVRILSKGSDQQQHTQGFRFVHPTRSCFFWGLYPLAARQA
jgi:hypothetical protein